MSSVPAQDPAGHDLGWPDPRKLTYEQVLLDMGFNSYLIRHDNISISGDSNVISAVRITQGRSVGHGLFFQMFLRPISTIFNNEW